MIVVWIRVVVEEVVRISQIFDYILKVEIIKFVDKMDEVRDYIKVFDKRIWKEELL